MFAEETRASLYPGSGFGAPLSTRVANEGEGAGKWVVDALDRAEVAGKASGGAWQARLFFDTQLEKLSRAQSFLPLDRMEGN